MAKIFVQDVVPSGKRSIRNIPLPGGGRIEAGTGMRAAGRVAERENTERMYERERATTAEERSRRSSPPPPPPRSERNERREQKPRSRIGLWVGILIFLLIVGFVGSFFFSSAKVSITPREINLPVDITASAMAKPGPTDLGFTIVTLSKEGDKEVPAGTESQISQKASGKIVIYNSYSSAPQILVANTRFESTDGHIFRINAQTTVPGQKTAGSGTIPGSVEVTVYADQPGDKYNIGLSDFTIPGFKGDPRFAKFSAKSDPASPITGGFIGTARKVTAADQASAKVGIETQLKNELSNQIASQIPETHVLFKGASTFDFTALPQENGSASTAMVREKGSIFGILFDHDQLSKYIASQVQEVGAKNVSIANLDGLTFSLQDMNNFDPNTTQKITFHLTGNAKFVWNIDDSKISESLAGQNRANIKPILGNFEEIDRANVSFSPVWVLTLPKDPAKIKVELDNNQQ